MSVEAVNLMQLIVAAFTAIGIIVAGFWALAQLVVGQFEKRLDERFATQEKARVEGGKLYKERLEKLEETTRAVERAHLKLLGDLPIHYVRREDYVRNQTIIEAKLDGLALRIENTILKGHHNA